MAGNPEDGQRAQGQGQGLGNKQNPHIVPQPEKQGQGDQDRFKMLGQAGLLPAAPGEFHKIAGAMHGVPHGLVDEREIGGVGVERIVPVDGVPRKIDRIGQN